MSDPRYTDKVSDDAETLVDLAKTLDCVGQIATMAQQMAVLVHTDAHFEDVRLVCRGGEVINSNMLLLAGLSPLFNNMIGDFKESGEVELQMPDLPAGGLEVLLATVRDGLGRSKEAQGAQRLVEALAAAKLLLIPESLTALFHDWVDHELHAGRLAELSAGAEMWALDKLTQQCSKYAEEKKTTEENKEKKRKQALFENEGKKKKV